MKKLWLLLLTLFMLAYISPISGQSSRADTAYSGQNFEDWAENVTEFVKDVRFNEEDIKSFISLADDFNAIGAQQNNEEEEFVDFDSIANNAEYLAWARSKGINSESWLKKTMRIMAVLIRSELEENRPQEQYDMAAQLKQLEAMRDQMGEQAYQSTVQAMKSASMAMQDLDNGYRKLPVPTEAEKKLLTQYRDELMNLE